MDHVIVAYADERAAQKIRSVLVSNGILVSGVCTTGAQILEAASRFSDGGVVVTGLRLPDMNAMQLTEDLPDGYEILLLLTQTQVALNQILGVSCLSLPLNRADLVDTVRMMLATGGGRRGKQRKEGDLRPRRTAEQEALIQEAKELLMVRNHFTEAQAHRYIQKKSMDTGKKMEETARLILEWD